MRKIHLDAQEVSALYDLGLTTEEVGRRLGCSRSTIDRHLAKRGLLRKVKRAGHLNPRWKGGRYEMANGYVAARVGVRHYRYEHRVVMELKLGRKLKKGDVVHHKNEDKTDNRPDNLTIEPSNAEHIKKHHHWQPERAKSAGKRQQP